jgi:hypothetical protein
MHPIEYAATLFVGAALLIAGYVFVAWTPWIIGLALVLLPVLGIPQLLNAMGRDPKKQARGDF